MDDDSYFWGNLQAAHSVIQHLRWVSGIVSQLRSAHASYIPSRSGLGFNVPNVAHHP